MFVDFFFVLSGFVIAAAYGDKFVAGRVTVSRFMGLRLGRIYPLHLAMILAMVGLELMLVLVDLAAVTNRIPFHGTRSLPALATNLSLLHVFGLHDQLTWNMPSWSIAAEIWAYLVFAMCFRLFGRQGWNVFAALGGLALGTVAIFASRDLNTTFDYGFFRCLYGFALGTIAYRMATKGLVLGGTVAEAAAVVACVLFVSLVEEGPATLLAPILFAFPVLVFAQGEGRLTRFLALRPFVWLGTVSYSIYMVHGFVQGRIGDFVKLAGEPFGLSLAAASDNPEFPSEVLTGSSPVLDVLTLVMLILVIVAASVSYLLIEQPSREKSRALLSPEPVTKLQSARPH